MAPLHDGSGAGAPWLSVLVPVWNVEPYLRQCVDSLMPQADAGVELLLLDDCSSDGSPALMQALQAQWGERIRLLAHPHNRGIAAARNTLLAQARGEHVWFVDSDDWVAPGVLPRLRQLLQREPGLDLVFLDYAVMRPRPRLKYRLRGELHKRGFVGRSRQRIGSTAEVVVGAVASGNLFVWAHVARRSLWHGVPAFPEGCSFEDMATLPRLLLRAQSAWHVPEPWLQYRRRDDSITALMSAAKVADLSRSLKGVRAELLQHWPVAPEPVRFILAHQAARNFIAAQRHARHLPAAEAAALWPRIRSDFAEAIGDDLALLQRGYLKRGWFLRALRLLKAHRDTLT